MKIAKDPDILENASFEEADTHGMGVMLMECFFCVWVPCDGDQCACRDAQARQETCEAGACGDVQSRICACGAGEPVRVRRSRAIAADFCTRTGFSARASCKNVRHKSHSLGPRLTGSAQVTSLQRRSTREGRFLYPNRPIRPKAPLDHVLFGCSWAIEAWLRKGTQCVWSINEVIGWINQDNTGVGALPQRASVRLFG